MSFFDDSHVTDVGLEGSAGPSVGAWDMLRQSWTQQTRVDAQQALEQEIDNRWRENLAMLEERSGQRFQAPDLIRSYISYHDKLNGVAEEPGSMWTRSQADAPQFRDSEWKRIEDADAIIRSLGDPKVKSFQDIVQEVFAMQREIEGKTGEMSSRADARATVSGFAGAMAGSFSNRDPLNIATLPFGGGGRTVAMRVATEMGVAGAVTATTEAAFVQPNRERAGLPERSLAFDVAASMVGAGLIRGGIEGIGAGVRRLRQPGQPIDVSFQDDQLRQMFENNVNSPRARAGEQALDDITFIEKNNPYGDTRAANARFLAEIEDVQRVMGGAPATAVARVLPPIPFDAIERAADFQIVKERSPAVYAELETAQARVAELNESIAAATASIEQATIIDAVRLVDEDAAAQLEVLSQRVNDEALPEPERAAADLEANAIIQRANPERAAQAFSGYEQRTKQKVRRMRSQRAAANQQYQAAYRKVEAEAEGIRRVQALMKGTQQADAVDVFGYATYGRPFNWSILEHGFVGKRVDAINAFNETLDEKSLTLFQKQEAEPRVEGEEPVEPKPVYDRGDGTYDIGLRDPVDGEFRFTTDDGDMSVAEAMRDLDDDVALDEAMRTCLL